VDNSQSSQLINFNSFQQPEASNDFSKLFEALERPLTVLSQSQEALTNQCKVLCDKVAEIQLNQNSSMMNAGIGVATSKFVPPSSVSSIRNLLHVGDTRVHELHERMYQNIGTFIKPAFHKNPVPTGFACIHDHGPEYIPEVNTSIPLSISASNVPTSRTSSSTLFPSSSQSSSPMNSQSLLSETRRAPRSSSTPVSRNESTLPILTPLDNEIFEHLGGPDFDVLYNKMEHSFKTDMKNLLRRTSSIFCSKRIAPPLRGNKKDSIGHTMQENAVLSAACADTIRKLLELGNLNEAKEWFLLQMKLAASLGTDCSLIRVYERDRNMSHALSVSNTAAVITPIMKEEFKNARANGVVPYSNKKFFRNPTYTRPRAHKIFLTSITQ
jgi:hypothetical protein